MFLTMLMSEGIMVALVWFLFLNMRRFLSCASDSAASMAYTLSSGKVDGTPVPGFTATGFLLLGIVCFVIAADRVITITVVADYMQPYYKLVFTNQLGQLAAAASLLFNGCADLLVFSYLRRYKRMCERVVYNARKQILFSGESEAQR